jgi:hypothetical protein
MSINGVSSQSAKKLANRRVKIVLHTEEIPFGIRLNIVEIPFDCHHFSPQVKKAVMF